MGNAKAPHHKGSYHQASARIRAAAYANPDTRCWRCKRTLAQIRTLKPRARWTAGHLTAGQVDGPLLPECSPCNYGHGARLGNHMRSLRARRTGLTW